MKPKVRSTKDEVRGKFAFRTSTFVLLSVIKSSVYTAVTENMGWGVFTSEDIQEGEIIESSPVIVMSKEERKLLDQTKLHDYIFEWGKEKNQCCMAMGYIPVYNHSYRSNCEYEMDFKKGEISIKAVHFIPAGSELFINYNGDWDDEKPLWFDAR